MTHAQRLNNNELITDKANALRVPLPFPALLICEGPSNQSTRHICCVDSIQHSADSVFYYQLLSLAEAAANSRKLLPNWFVDVTYSKICLIPFAQFFPFWSTKRHKYHQYEWGCAGIWEERQEDKVHGYYEMKIPDQFWTAAPLQGRSANCAMVEIF